MTDKFMYIQNDNKEKWPFCRLQLVFEKFGYSFYWNYGFKFDKRHKSCQANEQENFWDYCKKLMPLVLTCTALQHIGINSLTYTPTHTNTQTHAHTHTLKYQGGRGHWAVNFTSAQSFKPRYLIRWIKNFGCFY